MEIIDQGIVFAGGKEERESKCCFPSSIQLSNGELLCSFQAATEKNSFDAHVLLARSSDDGKQWEAPYSPFHSEINGGKTTFHLAYLAEINPGRLIADLLWCDHPGIPSLGFFNPDTGGLLPTGIGLSESTDFGTTWTPPRKLDAGELNQIPIPVMGPICRVDRDTLICPFETSKRYDDAGPWLHKAAYFISHDDGKTWPEYKVVAHDPQSRILYWDHRIANLGQGRLVDFFWAYDNLVNKELNAYMSLTTDGGKHWSDPAETEIVGQPWPIAIDHDAFAVVVVDRHRSQNIKLYLTENFGQSFDAAEPIVIYDHHRVAAGVGKSLTEQLAEQRQWSYGLPSGIKLSNGNLMITYYAGTEAVTNIHWCEIRL